MTSEAPRVRFAPSPTGYLHIGGARTALFNWLYARRLGGQFILRIEDTDQARSTQESYQAILDSMRWLGLDWDEGPEVGGPHGPYTQTERLALYRETAERLVAEGKAYRCYATKEELDELRKQAESQKKQFFYPHLWRDKSERDWLPGQPYVIRFRTPLEGETAFDDLVFGRIRTPNRSIQDFVLLRSDGVPLYNFGAVVDDVSMKITLVARGRDHTVNTPMQVLLYQALGYPVPSLAHLPMMLAPDGKKLSKREAERYDIPVSVGAYRERGFSADGLLNYLVRFGWSHGDQEVFSRDEMVKLFDFKDVNRSDGKFDMKKCISINHQHLRDERLTPFSSYLEQLQLPLRSVGLEGAHPERLQPAVRACRERARTFVECVEALEFFLRDEPRLDEAARAAQLTPAVAPLLRELAKVVAAAPSFEAKPLEEAVHQWLVSVGKQIKEVAQPARVALTGRTASPGLFEVMEVLGKSAVLERLERGARLAEST